MPHSINLDAVYDEILNTPVPAGFNHGDVAKVLQSQLDRILAAHGAKPTLDILVDDDTQRGAVVVSMPWGTELELVLGAPLPTALRSRSGEPALETPRLLAELIAGDAAREHLAQLAP